MDKLELVIKTLHKNFAKDIVALDMRLASPLFDTFVICSAENVLVIPNISQTEFSISTASSEDIL